MNTEKDSKKRFYRNEKDYMNSYHWNYMVLELADFIENKLKAATTTTAQDGTNNKWGYFMEFCSDRGLNRRVFRKMIEYSVGQAFDSEADLINHEQFRSLKNVEYKVAPSTANDDCKNTTPAKNQQVPMANTNVRFDVLDDMF
ncbi:MAG: hypothetical protein M0Q01_03880 [Syntrophales bacterium]|jgi:hypothetical protein|nr:hypothetical protein [Syntrophales bacterium]